MAHGDSQRVSWFAVSKQNDVLASFSQDVNVPTSSEEKSALTEIAERVR